MVLFVDFKTDYSVCTLLSGLKLKKDGQNSMWN